MNENIFDILNTIKHPDVSEEELIMFSNNKYSAIRTEVAKCDKLNYETFKKLSKDEISAVVAAIARNPKTPNDILFDIFNNNNSYEIHRALAYNEKVPIE